jgi:hypothetical protein
MQMFGKCDFHAPHKDWANNPLEKQNWEAVEQWSQRLKSCGSCSCSVEQWKASGTSDDNHVTVINRPTPAVQQCGTTIDSHAFMVWVHFLWEGNNTGSRDLQLTGDGESTAFEGLTAAGCTSWDGYQRMHTANMFPSHLNTLSPKYFLQAWQNSGSTLFYFVQVDEYYPCCECDWSYPC